MEPSIHPMAPDFIPGFLPGPAGDDGLFTLATLTVLFAILGVGVLYFSIHALPEKIAHKTNSVQTQAIGLLAVLALFTHNNIFWVVALLLAAIRFPDLTTPLNSISNSLEALRKRQETVGAQDAPKPVEARRGDD